MIVKVIFKEDYGAFCARNYKQCAEVIVDADLVVGVFAHETDPISSGHEIEKEHDKEELHEWVLVCIQKAKAVDEGDLSADQQVRLLLVELL